MRAGCGRGDGMSSSEVGVCFCWGGGGEGTV